MYNPWTARKPEPDCVHRLRTTWWRPHVANPRIMPLQPDNSKHPGTPKALVKEDRRAIVLPVICCLVVASVYVGFMTSGSWTAQQNIANDYFTTFYDQLATSFLQGHLSLEAKPDPALLALENPYSPEERQGIAFPLDVSLYQGKYYLYFGPVPAILLLLTKAILGGQIGDQYLVLMFAVGTNVVEALIILKMWLRFYPETPRPIVAASMLFVGLVSPFTWILRQPNVYNAAILGGQVFFLAGLYAAFEALDRKSMAVWQLVVTGICWAGAVGSRITQILPVGLAATLLALGLIIKQRGRRDSTRKVIRGVFGYALPLALGMAALGWYNWARFGSVFETGIAYQLSGFPIQTYNRAMWSPAYAVQNAYNYILNPPKPTEAFPYLRPNNGFAKRPIVDWIRLPKIYWSQDVTGLLYTAPFLAFAIVTVIPIFRRRPLHAPSGDEQGSLRWLIISLWGCFLASAAFFLVFFWVAERYFGDYLPAPLLLSILGFWKVLRYFQGRRLRRALTAALGLGLIGASIIVSDLLALAVNPGQSWPP